MQEGAPARVRSSLVTPESSLRFAAMDLLAPPSRPRREDIRGAVAAEEGLRNDNRIAASDGRNGNERADIEAEVERRSPANHVGYGQQRRAPRHETEEGVGSTGGTLGSDVVVGDDDFHRPRHRLPNSTSSGSTLPPSYSST